MNNQRGQKRREEQGREEDEGKGAEGERRGKAWRARLGLRGQHE